MGLIDLLSGFSQLIFMFTFNLEFFIAFQIITGFSLSVGIVVIPEMMKYLIPPDQRRKFMNMNRLMTTLGILLSFTLSAILPEFWFLSYLFYFFSTLLRSVNFFMINDFDTPQESFAIKDSKRLDRFTEIVLYSSERN